MNAPSMNDQSANDQSNNNKASAYSASPAHTDILMLNYRACQQRISKLQYSITKTTPLFPLTTDIVALLNEQDEESIDALILRYSQCVSMIQDHLFRGIALLELENLADKSNRDKALLMEKLGAIKSAADFGTAALLRNKLTHHYPEEAQAQVDRMNLIVFEAAFVVQCFGQISHYIDHKFPQAKLGAVLKIALA